MATGHDTLPGFGNVTCCTDLAGVLVVAACIQNDQICAILLVVQRLEHITACGPLLWLGLGLKACIHLNSRHAPYDPGLTLWLHKLSLTAGITGAVSILKHACCQDTRLQACCVQTKHICILFLGGRPLSFLEGEASNDKGVSKQSGKLLVATGMLCNGTLYPSCLRLNISRCSGFLGP